MALEPGGYADKLGNRYEGRWVARQLLRLLNEEFLYVLVEPVGDDEQGVDLWVTRHDGTRQAQQCKARNGSKDTWTVSDLNSRGILSAMRRHLDRHDFHEFALVTAVSASGLGDICQSARDSTGDPQDFFKNQIEAVGEAKRKAFRQFCKCLELDPSEPHDLASACGYLRRTHFVLWADDQNTHEELRAWAGMLATGEPTTILAALVEYAENNLRKSITANDVRQHLAPLGFHPRRLSHDTRIGPAVEELQRQFEESVAPGLVAGRLIPREETKTVLDALEKDGVVVLHGTAGYGKTGVLYELTQVLRDGKHAFIPVRLDRREPSNTTRQFGQDLGLPESPALCLGSLAGDKMAVLILDQLDALRWTSAYSTNALDVCKSLVWEVRNLRSTGKPVGVVLACRTYDLEHDPEIRNWLPDSPQQKCCRIEVKALSEEAVKRVVESLGRGFATVLPREKRILQSPQHLAMWAELARAGEVQGFQTGVQLMRQFWENRYRELARAGVPPAQADEVIDRLAAYMQDKGRISVPYTLVADRPTEVQAMHSLGILHTTGSQVIFCHQSYLDFRIATRLLREVHQGKGTVRAWLGDKSRQSLFRREQLRQVLALLSEEAPHDFVASVQDLLQSPDTRFHLKHLVLELLGQMEEPGAPLLAYLRGLLEASYWRDHVLETVCSARLPYVKWLVKEGIITRWLESSEQKDAGAACWLLRSVADLAPDLVAAVLEPYADRNEEWGKRVLGSLSWDEENDSDRMFALRLRLARRGIAREWPKWGDLAAKHPRRVIQLIEAVASTWTTDNLHEHDLAGQRAARRSHSRFERWDGGDLAALKKVASEIPDFTWDALMPHVERLTTPVGNQSGGLAIWQDGGHLQVHERYTGAERGVVELLIEAGRCVAGRNGQAFIGRTRALRDSTSPITQVILLEAYVALPAGHANEALLWLMADPSRLALGSGEKEPEWMPAARLIKAHSPHCSEGVFRQLEESLVHYHAGDERRNAEWCLKGWREGWFNDFWGRAQHFFLPALCPKRRRPETTGLIGVLERKFAGYEPWRFLRSGYHTGGWVGSPLPSNKLERVSDKAWLGIVGNKDILPEHSGHSKQVGKDSVAESTVRMFSRDLAQVSKRFPERFARLALRFPENVHPHYIGAVLEGLKQTKPADGSEAEKAGWHPAPIDLVEAVLAKFASGHDREVASEFCWLVHDRADEQWSEGSIKRLIHYATSHPDPESGQLNMWASDKGRDVANATAHDLTENALNCVRGVAALAVGALLGDHPDWLGRLKACIEHLVADPHPAVRAAGVEACLPVLNIDRPQAIEWFCKASNDDLRVAASRAGAYYFNCGMNLFCEKIAPIIRGMLASPYEDVAQEGAEEVTARWLFGGMFAEDLKACQQGSIPHRKGVAQVASHFVLQDEYTSRCQDLLVPLFDDPEKAVRQQTVHCLRDKGVFSIPNASEFIGKYVHSQAYLDDPSPLFFAIEEHAGSLTPYSELILSICEVFCGSLRDASRDMATGVAADTHMIPPLLLRLYEQAQGQGDADTVNRCLDAWDLLFENRVGMTRELTVAIER